MKLKITLLAFLLIGFNAFAQEQTENQEIALAANQSMSITGKGPGQDGTINPFYGQDSVAIVSNMGDNPFSVRIQKQGKIIEEIAIEPNLEKEIFLKAGQELYFDSTLAAKSAIRFKEVKKE